jgi:pimeloyl-ACP methyl ester carboxylesterase
MLGHSGIPFEEFKVHNVEVTADGHYVRTYQVGWTKNKEESNKEKMVLIHGYGGSSVMFWKIIKPLAENFHLIMIDILGMGASSRPEFNC